MRQGWSSRREGHSVEEDLLIPTPSASASPPPRLQRRRRARARDDAENKFLRIEYDHLFGMACVLDKESNNPSRCARCTSTTCRRRPVGRGPAYRWRCCGRSRSCTARTVSEPAQRVARDRRWRGRWRPTRRATRRARRARATQRVLRVLVRRGSTTRSRSTTWLASRRAASAKVRCADVGASGGNVTSGALHSTFAWARWRTKVLANHPSTPAVGWQTDDLILGQRSASVASFGDERALLRFTFVMRG